MRTMTDEEVRAFVRHPGRTAKLATVCADGRPHCVPIWCSAEDDGIWFMTMGTTLKARNITRDPRVSLSFDSEVFPYAFVTPEGNAEFVHTDADALLAISTRIAARYVPAGQEATYGARNAVPEERLVCVTITKVISATGVAD